MNKLVEKLLKIQALLGEVSSEVLQLESTQCVGCHSEPTERTAEHMKYSHKKAQDGIRTPPSNTSLRLPVATPRPPKIEASLEDQQASVALSSLSIQKPQVKGEEVVNTCIVNQGEYLTCSSCGKYAYLVIDPLRDTYDGINRATTNDWFSRLSLVGGTDENDIITPPDSLWIINYNHADNSIYIPCPHCGELSVVVSKGSGKKKSNYGGAFEV